jgi:hypothetical protein
MNGGAKKQLPYGTSRSNDLAKIIKCIISIDDLNLLCRVCNALHHLELKYGKLPYLVEYSPD